ncbi:chemotaxis protein CheW [Chitinimonas prasina]|uniref:Chemotaxis protein CheW n=1 Tax=Chitinimonas prasina TaxID=1434937 RepID=A0ABQ5YPX6_9NEIS|nr:chemotaxis protein CheW [Chitinimonas prasina]GLR14969.1 chemotaxis protein CheW [Chitinimonas prasina]
MADQDPTSQPRAGEYLVFTLGREEYGIDILKVQEIRRSEHVTEIANLPSFIKGVINLRGAIVPIVDLRVKFACSEASYDRFTVVIILNISKRVVGIVVDGVSDVVMLSSSLIQSPPSFGSAIDTAYISGLGTLEERMIILTDIEKLMTSQEMHLTEVAAEATI